MNKERLLELADVIEHTPHKQIKLVDNFDREITPTFFNMGVWHCGSAACIGGWTNALYNTSQWDCSEQAAQALDLDELTSDLLFFPNGYAGWQHGWEYEYVTPAMAATVLRHFADTGIVDWSIVAEDMDLAMAAAPQRTAEPA